MDSHALKPSLLYLLSGGLSPSVWGLPSFSCLFCSFGVKWKGSFCESELGVES